MNFVHFFFFYIKSKLENEKDEPMKEQLIKAGYFVSNSYNTQQKFP